VIMIMAVIAKQGRPCRRKRACPLALPICPWAKTQPASHYDGDSTQDKPELCLHPRAGDKLSTIGPFIRIPFRVQKDERKNRALHRSEPVMP
jgi:hypothetical protein